MRGGSEIPSQPTAREPNGALFITDSRTGRTYDVPIEDGVIRATALRQLKVSEDDFGLMSYDPAFLNTASCRSAVTYIDGENGILRYRGYPIEQLAERSTFLEVAYLLIDGEWPTAAQLETWVDSIKRHTLLHEDLKRFFNAFPRDAHPMAILASAVAALSAFYQGSEDPENLEHVEISTIR